MASLLVHSTWLACPNPAMGRNSARTSALERRNAATLPTAVSNLGGTFGVTHADSLHGSTIKISRKESRVFQLYYQKQDADHLTVRSSVQNRNAASRSFLGAFLEKALGVFLKSQHRLRATLKATTDLEDGVGEHKWGFVTSAGRCKQSGRKERVSGFLYNVSTALQLDQCGDMSVAVGGSNWELLRGKARNVQVSATKAVYKGVVLTEVDLTASKVLVKLGRKRLLQHPFHVHAHIRVREQDLNSSLASPYLSSSLKEILPKNPPTLQVRFDSGNLRFSTPDQRSGQYGQIEYPITLSMDVEESGEAIFVKSLKSDSFEKTYKVGPEVKITHLEVDNSWLSLTAEFLVTPP